MAYDGTNFWIGDYSGTNHAYMYSPTGTLLATISLGMCEGYCDGLEYFNGMLISNRYDGGFARAGGNQYDIYDLAENLITADFIDTNGHGNGTGIAFDGTDFFISDIFNNKISVWDGTTGAWLRDITMQVAILQSRTSQSITHSVRTPAEVRFPSRQRFSSSAPGFLGSFH
jgi:hypothetical protein